MPTESQIPETGNQIRSKLVENWYQFLGEKLVEN